MEQRWNHLAFGVFFLTVFLTVCTVGLFDAAPVSASEQTGASYGGSEQAVSAAYGTKRGETALPLWERYTAGQQLVYRRSFGKIHAPAQTADAGRGYRPAGDITSGKSYMQQRGGKRLGTARWTFDRRTKHWILDVTKKETHRPDPVRMRLDLIAEGKLAYDEDSVMQVGETFAGFRSNQECKGYARNVFYLCFKATPGKTGDKPDNHLLEPAPGVLQLATDDDVCSVEDVKRLFRKARTGDFVQMRRFHGGPHSAIVYKTERDGVTFMEANTDFHNTITKTKHSWESLDRKNAKMTVYTAEEYKLK